MRSQWIRIHHIAQVEWGASFRELSGPSEEESLKWNAHVFCRSQLIRPKMKSDTHVSRWVFLLSPYFSKPQTMTCLTVQVVIRDYKVLLLNLIKCQKQPGEILTVRQTFSNSQEFSFLFVANIYSQNLMCLVYDEDDFGFSPQILIGHISKGLRVCVHWWHPFNNHLHN